MARHIWELAPQSLADLVAKYLQMVAPGTRAAVIPMLKKVIKEYDKNA